MDPKGLNLFDGIVYINLPHRKDRKKEILAELKGFQVSSKKIHRIEAIFDPLNGHRGCALSHIKALELAIEKKWTHVLILEDDCTLTRDIETSHEILHHFLQTAENNWDVFLLGGRILSFQKNSKARLKRALSAQCAHAYAVNSSYFETLRSFYLSCVKDLEEKLFFSEALPYAIDWRWDTLMEKDRWYFIEIFAQQRASFSDTNVEYRSPNPPRTI